MRIKELLKKSEFIHYWGVCLKMCRDETFRIKLFTLYDTPDALMFKHLGKENPSKNIYLMYCNNPTRGFFSLFNLVLDGLQFADYYHLTPVIQWGSSTLYHEKDGVNGIKNSYEFYFRQTSNVSVESARESENVVFYEFSHRKLSIPDFNLTVGASLTDNRRMEEYLNKRAEIIRKYIRFSDEVERHLEDTVHSLLQGERTLGIHVRGTDMRAGYNGHARIVPPEEYLSAARKVFKEKKFDKIFLATDEAAVIQLFEQEFGSRLLYFTDIMRSENGEALHFSYNKRKHHQYLLGLEVLRDMYALSICDGLIAGISNVSLAARMMKKSYKKEYEYIDILSNGFNQTNISMEQKEQRKRSRERKN